MQNELWVPTKSHERTVRPDNRKAGGGSWFDDELGSENDKANELAHEVSELLHHLNARPDHVVYVESSQARTQIREVFNWWRKEGALMHDPTIRIEYALNDGAAQWYVNGVNSGEWTQPLSLPDPEPEPEPPGPQLPRKDRWDMMILVRYPTRQRFIEMVTSEAYLSVVHLREQALEDSVLYATDPLA